jgi:hypothetical protein
MFGRFGGFLSGVLTPKIYEATGDIEPTFWVSFALNFLAIPSILIINYYDKENLKRRKEIHYKHQESLHL